MRRPGRCNEPLLPGLRRTASRAEHFFGVEPHRMRKARILLGRTI